MTVLTENQVENLCNYVENKIEKIGCDHSLKNTFEWAQNNGVDKNDLIDVLESNGGFCDCEVVTNLPEECDLTIEIDNNETDIKNPFKIPADFILIADKIYTKAIFSNSEYDHNNYTKNGELLIPPPFGYKPKKRVRKSMHFFNGLETELPTEVGFIKSIEPTNAKGFAKKIRDLKLKPFEQFSEREADYYLSKADIIDLEKPVATHFMEINTSGGKKIHLRIHKILIRK
tara:strand:- start:9795 stop:10484 length:690 start_codon:yes stop_codon:yes gene_type:complete